VPQPTAPLRASISLYSSLIFLLFFLTREVLPLLSLNFPHFQFSHCSDRLHSSELWEPHSNPAFPVTDNFCTDLTPHVTSPIYNYPCLGRLKKNVLVSDELCNFPEPAFLFRRRDVNPSTKLEGLVLPVYFAAVPFILGVRGGATNRQVTGSIPDGAIGIFQ
jgi:hypothetical protein